jgi:hypothetical protein
MEDGQRKALVSGILGIVQNTTTYPFMQSQKLIYLILFRTMNVGKMATGA